MSDHRIIRRASIPDEPWRNGGGTTRELAAHIGSGGGIAWRISVATITRSGPFSSYPAIARTLVVISGTGRLRTRNRDYALAAHSLICFDGDDDVEAQLVSPACQVLNIMTARPCWRHRADIVGEGLPAWTEPAALRFCVPLVGGDADYALMAGDLVTLGDAPLPPIRPAVFIAIDRTG